MPAIAVVGGQWGDEGKGKVIDLLSGDAEVVIRAHGGDNAGHTVVNPAGEFALHLVPAGIFNPDATCVIAPGVALNPAVLINEMNQLERRGVATDKLLLSDRAQMVMPYHLLLDHAQEAKRGINPIGTTGRGIGPAYEDKVARVGLRVGDLADPALLRGRLSVVLGRGERLLAALGQPQALDLEAVLTEYAGYAQRLEPYICDVAPVIAAAVERNAAILLEGAQGTLLDLDHGTYPYATTSSCTVAGLCQGSGIPPRAISHAIGVYKAYSTRVGAGPMPTELQDQPGDYLRERAHEFGATTGRARRVGWFDAAASRYTACINGFDSIALTRLDILDELDTIKICTGYRLDNQMLETPPSDPVNLGKCEPLYEEMEGWKMPTRGASDFDDLPVQAIAYVERIELLVRVPVALVGVGPERSERIVRQALWEQRSR